MKRDFMKNQVKTSSQVFSFLNEERTEDDKLLVELDLAFVNVSSIISKHEP